MKKTDKDEVEIIHIMADGTIRNSIEGYVVPYNEKTKRAYQILADFANRQAMEAQLLNTAQ